MYDLAAIVLISVSFLLAGAVKGVIGLGLPTLSLGLLAAAFDLTTAMALMIVPSLVTNLWQAASGGNGRKILVRTWPFLLAATLTVWVGAAALTRLDLALLSGLLGMLLMAYSAIGLAGINVRISAKNEAWAGPALGAVNGIFTGMTGSFAVPGIMYLQAIGLTRDMLVQAMGMLFSASTIALAVALEGNSLMTGQLFVASTTAVVPAAVGMVIGQRIRYRLPEQRFRRVFFLTVLVLGAYIVAHAAIGLR